MMPSWKSIYRNLKPGAASAVVLALFFWGASGWCGAAERVSGRLVNGFRVIDAAQLKDNYRLSVYRGDYIKFDLEGGSPVKFSIPALGMEKKLVPGDEAPYFKMKQVGVFDMVLGTVAGTIQVVEYKEAHYRSVSAREAQEVIRTFSPLILDVRTAKEYRSARIENALLLPVQELQNRWSELAPHKDDPILIYCATGNRSTVAAKILIDRGFTRIFNLRHGIADWYKNSYPIIR